MQDPTQPEADRETDALAERFFSQPPEAWEVEPEPESWRPAPLTKHERLAMLATVAPVVIGLSVAIGSFVFSEPLPASAEVEGTTTEARAAAAAPRVSHDSTHHGLTALAKASPSVPLAEPAGSGSGSGSESGSGSGSGSGVEVATPAPAAVAPTASTTPASAPRTVAAPRPAAAGSPLKRARQALDAGKPHDARAFADQAIAKNPASAAGYIVLAGALDALGDRAGMRAVFRSCAERATDALASACRSLAR